MASGAAKSLLPSGEQKPATPSGERVAPMNRHEFEQLRRAMGFEKRALARALGISDSTLGQMARGVARIGERHAVQLRAWDARATEIAWAIHDHGFGCMARLSTQPGEDDARAWTQVRLARVIYDHDEDLARLEPEFAGLPVQVHACGIERGRQLLEAEDAALTVAVMQREDYAEWLAGSGQEHGREALEAWAMGAGVVLV